MKNKTTALILTVGFVVLLGGAGVLYNKLSSGVENQLLVQQGQVQEQIKNNCKEDLFTVIMRRFMVRLANVAARMSGAGALVTGESLGQVASQTMEALNITDEISAL